MFMKQYNRTFSSAVRCPYSLCSCPTQKSARPLLSTSSRITANGYPKLMFSSQSVRLSFQTFRMTCSKNKFSMGWAHWSGGNGGIVLRLSLPQPDGALNCYPLRFGAKSGASHDRTHSIGLARSSPGNDPDD